MAETEDPHAALGEKGVARRAAATRDLARTGTVDDALGLIDVATRDKSTSVRLYAAAAASEILMRHRGAYGQTRLTPAQAAEVSKRVGAGDPAQNPALLGCYAAIPDPQVIQRLTRALRDPRNGVRAGAAVALRRMALSGAQTLEAVGLREWVGEALGHSKLPTDAAIELVRLVGEVGWVELAPLVRAQSTAGGQVAEAVTECLERLAERDRPEAWVGVWLDEGLDVLQLGTTAEPTWRVIDPATAGRAEKGRLKLEEGAARRVWAPRLKEEGVHAALQVAGRTWWRKEGPALVQLVEDLDVRLGQNPGFVEVIAAGLAGLEGAAATRARAILWVRTGRHAEALDTLEPLIAAKKSRNDLLFLHGLALAGVGRREEARAAFTAYVEKAKKKEPWRAEAEAWLMS